MISKYHKMETNTPFQTTALRRLWVFIGLWAIAIISIISYITVPRMSGVLSLLQAVGIFYYESQVALNTFASAATVPASAVLLTYGILAAILFGISVVILDLMTFYPDRAYTKIVYDNRLNQNRLMVGLILLGLLPITIALAVDTIAIITLLIPYALQLSPPALSLSPIAVAIAVITSYVP